MERNKPYFSEVSAHECPILCITKAILFVIIAVFVLYLPLGDPEEHCSRASIQNNVGALCCLCDVRKFLLKTARKTTDAAEVIICVIMDALYEAKLKFYSMLEVLDRKDLCRSVCCHNDADDQDDLTDRHSRSCRCTRKKCRRN